GGESGPGSSEGWSNPGGGRATGGAARSCRSSRNTHPSRFHSAGTVTSCRRARTTASGDLTPGGRTGSGDWCAARAPGGSPTWRPSCGWRTPLAQQRNSNLVEERIAGMRSTSLLRVMPLGALAACGLMRCCEEMEAFRGARLGWRPDPEWFAVLETDGPADPDTLVAALVARQQHRPKSPELNWARTIKTSTGEYLEATRAASEELWQGHRAYADFLAAFGCELAANDEGQIEPTAFYMTSGRQEFLKEARTLAARLAEGIK